jgi:hypothetical protein
MNVFAEVLERVPERLDDPRVHRVDRRVVEPDGFDHAGIPENISRSSVFLNLPTLAGLRDELEPLGSHHFAKSGARNARSSSAVAVALRAARRRQAGARPTSDRRAMTAASAMAGCAISAFSSSTDEITRRPT